MREKVERILSEDGRPQRAERRLMTEEERAQFDAARTAWREMNPQERFELRQKWHQERIDSLSPEAKAQYEKHIAKDKEVWAAMSAEEKEAALKKLFRSFGPRDGFRGYHCGEWRGRHHGGPRYDRERHYDRYHHDGHCDWGTDCPFYDGDDK